MIADYRSRRVASLLFLATVLVSPASAWPSDESLTREIYHDRLQVRMANGKIGSALITIKVAATLSIQEDGNANFPDDRNCHFRNVRRSLIRELSLTMPDGTVVPVRDTVIALPAGTEKHWRKVTPCNDVAGQVNGHLTGEIGSADSWRTYVSGQEADARKIIAQFGQIIS